MSEVLEIMVHRIALDLRPGQDEVFRRCAGIARFSWNWALARWQDDYAAYRADPSLPRPNEATLRRQINAIKRVEFPWMLEAPKAVPQQAIKNLGTAFGAFFAGRARYPRFKAKDRSRDSFRVDNGPGTFCVEGRRLKVPRIGWLNLREELRFTGEPMSAVISRDADRWFVSIAVRRAAPAPLPAGRPAVGVDLGITDLAVLSDGRRIKGAQALKRRLRQLKRASRAHSRKRKGSANRRKSAQRLARLHARIANIRRDGLRKLTTMLVREHGQICIEDLNVRGMMRNHRIARAISDMGFYEFRRQLAYKAARAGTEIIYANRFFASSKTCSGCGAVVDVLPLSVRTWTCAGCGAHHDRDLNAAINLRNLAGSEAPAGCRPVSACGVEGADAGLAPDVKPATTKQELAIDQIR
ncbi:RNA-guided endonuclease InsQ/TnpB family protein, partial [Palleronia sp.]|uniref:RNA-guided endonuclease InsQ/TnpB family protein n=1 Tax=Palleronia sp. TaxID=1940284 RepID=UPI0035C78D7C